jgi:release factor glutamine methyltransferase
MMNSKTLFRELRSNLTLKASDIEKNSILFQLLEQILGVTRADIIVEKGVTLDQGMMLQLNGLMERINHEEPIQYVLGECEFYGRIFKVNKDVLIPRPETEELIRTALPLLSGSRLNRILDIGTGSGCIATTLSLEIKMADVYASDISLAALTLARENAQRLGASVTFARADILLGELPCHDLDMIVSNPPYVTTKDKISMSKNVLGYEPSEALFVPEDDPLLFYSAILSRAVDVLNMGGTVVVEINEQFGVQVADLFTAHNFKGVQIIADINGKDRIVCGISS